MIQEWWYSRNDDYLETYDKWMADNLRTRRYEDYN